MKKVTRTEYSYPKRPPLNTRCGKGSHPVHIPTANPLWWECQHGHRVKLTKSVATTYTEWV